MLRLMILSCLCAAASAQPPPNPCTAAECTPIFYPGLNGSQCYRIPSIIATHRGTLLAFAENRLGGCGDQGTHNLVVRRSSDNGATWGPLITVFAGVVPCPGCPAAVSNPNPVEVTFPNGTRSILLAFDTMNNPRPWSHGLDMTMWSHDDGVSWVGARATEYPPQPNVGSLIGPAVGLQLQAPEARGQIVFWITSGFGFTSGFLAVSKDYGETFTASQHVLKEPGSECSIAFAAGPGNSTLIMNCRSGQDSRRAQLYWSLLDNGTYASTEPTYPTQLTDPGCQGSILSAAAGAGSVPGSGSGAGAATHVLYTSNAASTSARERMTIHRSDDGGVSWSAGQVIHAGPSAYSQLVQLPNGSMAVLFEAGVRGAYETISFAPFAWTPPHTGPDFY